MFTITRQDGSQEAYASHNKLDYYPFKVMRVGDYFETDSPVVAKNAKASMYRAKANGFGTFKMTTNGDTYETTFRFTRTK